MLFMVVEQFKDKDALPVYRRFRDHGRMAPEGLEYVSSWVDDKLERCFQIMQPNEICSIVGSRTGAILSISRSFRFSPRKKQLKGLHRVCDRVVMLQPAPRADAMSGNPIRHIDRGNDQNHAQNIKINGQKYNVSTGEPTTL